MTEYVLTLVAAGSEILDQSCLDKVSQIISTLKDGQEVKQTWLAINKAKDIYFSATIEKNELERKLLSVLPNIDVALQGAAPEDLAHRKKKLLVADMDSTMIQMETLDYLADQLGFGDKVAEITERGLMGALDFSESLRERVILLKDQPAEDAFNKVLADITYTAGAEVTVKTMRKYGAYAALVSGGFTFTTDMVAPKLGFNEARANILLIENGKLTGTVADPILARDSKEITMRELCNKLEITPRDAVCIGDGANDLDMIQAAGMGVGFHGRPIVQEKAEFNIRYGDMTCLLYFQGYTSDEFVSL